MLKTCGDDEDVPDFSVMNFKQRHSSVKSDGTVLLTTPKIRGLKRLFTKQQQTKVILGVKRVPFMALYQVILSVNWYWAMK